LLVEVACLPEQRAAIRLHGDITSARAAAGGSWPACAASMRRSRASQLAFVVVLTARRDEVQRTSLVGFPTHRSARRSDPSTQGLGRVSVGVPHRGPHDIGRPAYVERMLTAGSEVRVLFGEGSERPRPPASPSPPCLTRLSRLG